MSATFDQKLQQETVKGYQPVLKF